jgi:hypothetical protein
MHLIDIEPGIWVNVIGFDGGEKFQNRLFQHGLYPGDRARRGKKNIGGDGWMKFALAGRSNCGKSRLFNQVAGYKAETGNFQRPWHKYNCSRFRYL